MRIVIGEVYMEKRKFSRTGFHTAGKVITDTAQIDVSVVDLSLRGALFASPTPLTIGNTVQLEINLMNSEVVIATEGKLVHQEDEKYGIRFSSIDAESMIHLRSLMEYNTERFEEIGTELGFLFRENPEE